MAFQKPSTKKTKYKKTPTERGKPAQSFAYNFEYSYPTHRKQMERLQKTHLNNKKSVFGKLTNEEYMLINSFFSIVDDALKLKPKQKKATFKAIRELFQELTSERENKNIDYLSDPSKLSAYIYYYLWWNLLRFVRLFNGLSLQIKAGDVIGDFGSGPLTLVLALWIAKPELREKKLTFYCIDISDKAMRAGEEIFRILTSFKVKRPKVEKNNQKARKRALENSEEREELNWKIKRVVAPFGAPLKEKLDFFFSANMFNEICWNNIKHLKTYVEKQATIITSYLKDLSSIFIIEPGLPIGGKIISIFRNFFLQRNYSVIAPCPHANSCPLHENTSTGKSEIFQEYSLSQVERTMRLQSSLKESVVVARGKWCHFAFSTLDAPTNLVELSEKVHLAKKTASLSYLYCGKDMLSIHTKNERRHKPEANRKTKIIVTSNIIKLKDGSLGVYACSAFGFLLLKAKHFDQLKALKSGTYTNIDPKRINSVLRDKKSGALIVEMD